VTGPVARRFDAAAGSYETATPIQRKVAGTLARRIMSARPYGGGRVAEFGCGTGYLAEVLAPVLRPELWIATDIAPAMAAVAARRASGPNIAVAVMDATRPALGGSYDLVCSSLTLQWLSHPAQVLARWRAMVRPGGALAVATLLDGTFAEWRAALAAAGAPTPEPKFATLDQVRGWFGPSARIETLPLTQKHEDALAFARSAKASGIDAGGARALPAGVMRRALKLFEESGSSVTYNAALIVERA